MMSAPGPAVWLAATQTVLGENLWWHRVLHLGLGVATVALLSRMAIEATGAVTGGVVAALALGLQPGFVYSTTLPLKTSLVLFLLAAGLDALLRVLADGKTARPGLWLGIATGCLLGAAVTQLSLLGVPILLGVLAALGLLPGRRHRAKLAIALLAIVPLHAIALGLCRHGGASSHLRFWPQSGVHMLIGLGPGATGRYQPVPGLENSPRGHTFEARLLAETSVGRVLSPEASDAWYRVRVAEHLRRHPGEVGRTLWRKLRLFFADYEPKENFSIDELRSRSATLRWLPMRWGVLVVLAAAGGASLAAQRRWAELRMLGGLVGVIVASTLATFVTTRYRYPAAIPLALLAGHAVAGFGARRTSVLVAGLIAVPLAFAPVVTREERDAERWRAEGNRRRAETVPAFLERLGEIRKAPLSESRLEAELAILRSLRRESEAFAVARRGVAALPTNRTAAATVLEYLILLGHYEEAEGFVRERVTAERDAAEDLGQLLPAHAGGAYWRFIYPRLRPAPDNARPEGSEQEAQP